MFDILVHLKERLTCTILDCLIALRAYPVLFFFLFFFFFGLFYLVSCWTFCDWFNFFFSVCVLWFQLFCCYPWVFFFSSNFEHTLSVQLVFLLFIYLLLFLLLDTVFDAYIYQHRFNILFFIFFLINFFFVGLVIVWVLQLLLCVVIVRG